MNGSARPRCVSFWYYMYEPIVDTTGPNLGKLAIWTRTIDKSVIFHFYGFFTSEYRITRGPPSYFSLRGEFTPAQEHCMP